MRVVIFGATGGTGRNLVEKALAAGHEVTAFARRPEAVTAKHERLRVAQGDALDAASVARAIAGQDAVLSALGPAAGSKPGVLISQGTKNILAGMREHGARRFVFESGIMVGDGRGMGAFKRIALGAFRALNRALYEDKVVAERAIRESATEWTIVRPPSLAHAPEKGSYRVGPDLDADLMHAMAHADVADCMVKLASDPGAVGKTLDVSY